MRRLDIKPILYSKNNRKIITLAKGVYLKPDAALS
jgi:hypothetical protein